ncbi:venom protein 164-like [Ruditapes philippinarum]|uniref:venom protein 164-like n=1 Tax=Ruditapes philippinarum TaxID=129788 RepID=UPI00295A5B73|nr:venom protein 164-like [Ruditapes philippinarum]
MAMLKLFFLFTIFTVTSSLFLAHDCQMSSLALRYSTCPPGSCCCQDPTQSGQVYCKPISDVGGPCYAAAEEWPESCPCKSSLTCVPNLQVPTWTSKYGRCQNVTTSV